MTHEEVFLQEILENRDDDLPRRVYADWLIDHGDEVNAARGEFIHLQCDLARCPYPRPAALLKRERELLDLHGREWGSLFSRLNCACWEYRRGFVEGVGMPASALLSQGSALFRATPLRQLKLTGSSGLWGELANCVHLARVDSLDLERNDLGDADVEALSFSPQLGGLTTLLLWSNRIGDAGLLSLLGANLPRLQRLDLSENHLTDAAAQALAQSPFLRRLRLLDLTGNQVTDAGARALLVSPHAGGLACLELSKNPVSIGIQNALREWHAARAGVEGLI